MNATQPLNSDGVLGRYVADSLPAGQGLFGQAQRVQHDLAAAAGSEHLVNEIRVHASIVYVDSEESSEAILNICHKDLSAYAPPMTFGTRLRDLRKAKGLSQEELGRDLGPGGESVSKQAVSNWEKDRFIPSIHEIPKICDRLGCSADYLICGRQAPDAVSQEVFEIAKLLQTLDPDKRGRLLAIWRQMVPIATGEDQKVDAQVGNLSIELKARNTR